MDLLGQRVDIVLASARIATTLQRRAARLSRTRADEAREGLVRIRVRACVTRSLGLGAGGVDGVDRRLERHLQDGPDADARPFAEPLGGTERRRGADIVALRERDG